jgi:hypothetical protein
MRVSNMEGRSGRPVANQFVIEDDDTETFQSYKTTIAVKRYVARTEGQFVGVTLDHRALDYSVTTSRYLYQFLTERSAGTVDRASVKRAIASGTYAVADLNRGRR